MKTLKTVLLAGAIALASTAAFAQMNDQTKAPHNAGTDQGTTKPAQAAPTVGMDAGANVKAPGATMNSKNGAEIGPNNPTGSRPSEDTVKPGDMNKTR